MSMFTYYTSAMFEFRSFRQSTFGLNAIFTFNKVLTQETCGELLVLLNITITQEQQSLSMI